MKHIYKVWQFVINGAFVTITFLLLPIWLLVWLSIVIESGRPGLLRQERVGAGSRHFTCYKFRSLRKGTAMVGTHFLEEHDVTRVGAVLRRLKIDEIPQAINIGRGEMNLIGPRPCLPSQKEVISNRRERGVDSTKPGITGLSQSLGIDMSQPEILARTDSLYIATQSFQTDIKIIFRTLGFRFGERLQPN